MVLSSVALFSPPRRPHHPYHLHPQAFRVLAAVANYFTCFSESNPAMTAKFGDLPLGLKTRKPLRQPSNLEITSATCKGPSASSSRVSDFSRPALEWTKASNTPNAPPQANGAYTVYRTRVKKCVVFKSAGISLLKRGMVYV